MVGGVGEDGSQRRQEVPLPAQLDVHLLLRPLGPTGSNVTGPQHPTSQGLFLQRPASPAASFVSYLSRVNRLDFVLLAQSKKTLNYVGSHIGISFLSSEEMRPGVQSTVGDNGDSLNLFSKC